MFRELLIYNVDEKKIRLGPKKDGGYVVLKKFSKSIDTLFSFGVENNVDFEIDFQKRFLPKKICLYDHTISSLPKKKNNFIFFKKGLASVKKKNFLTLNNIAQELDCNNNFLKLDIEFDEWDVFETVYERNLLKFNQIICEFHFFFLKYEDVDKQNILTPYFKKFSINNYKKINKILFYKYQNVLSKINKNFYIFHISANNSLPSIKVFGKKIPQLLEISFVRKDLIKNISLFKGILPVKNLDFPNKSYKDDIINFYPFK